MTEHLNLAGRLTLLKWSRDGQLVERRTVANDITLAGRDLVARLFNRERARDPIARVSEMRVGGGQDPFDPKATALVRQIGNPVPIAAIDEVEVAAASGRMRKLLRLTAELGEADGNGDLHEAGLFTADGVMYNRVIFDTITKSDQFRLSLVWEIAF